MIQHIVSMFVPAKSFQYSLIFVSQDRRQWEKEGEQNSKERGRCKKRYRGTHTRRENKIQRGRERGEVSEREREGKLVRERERESE